MSGTSTSLFAGDALSGPDVIDLASVVQAADQALRVSDNARKIADQAQSVARVEKIIAMNAKKALHAAKVALNALVGTHLEGNLTSHSTLLRLC